MALKAKRTDINAIVFYCLIIAFPVLQFCVFYIGVNFNSVILSFKDYDAISGEYTFIWFDNFVRFARDIFSGTALTYAVKNSILLWAIGLGVGTVGSLLFSYYIYKKCYLYNLMRVLLYLPSMLPSIALVFIYLIFMSRGIPSIGGKDLFAVTDTQFFAVIIFNVWIGFGSSVILYSSAMSQVSEDIMEAARIDGANSFVEFYKILLPSIYPTLCTFLVTGIANIFINQANLYSFFGSSANVRNYTIGYYLFVQIAGKANMSTYPYAAAGGLLMTLIAAPLTLLIKYLLEKFGPSED